MKLLIGLAFAAAILVVAVIYWNGYQRLHAADAMQDVNFDLACTEAFVRAGQGDDVEARNELDACKKKGWKAP